MEKTTTPLSASATTATEPDRDWDGIEGDGALVPCPVCVGDPGIEPGDDGLDRCEFCKGSGQTTVARAARWHGLSAEDRR